MIEKRFIIDEYFEIGSVVIDTENENVRFKHENKLSMKQCCNLLNELHEENEQLQQRNKRLEERRQRERTSFRKTHKRWSKEAETKIKELSEENEQLKQQIDNICREINDKPTMTTTEVMIKLQELIF